MSVSFAIRSVFRCTPLQRGSAGAADWSAAVRLTRRRLHASAAAHLRVLFFGTDDVSLHTLRALDESRTRLGEHAGLVTRLDVVCPGDRPAGRGQRMQPVPVKAFAAQQGLTTYDVPFGL